MTARKAPTLKVELEPDQEDQAIAALQDDLERVKNSRNEERFLLTTIIIVLIDALLFKDMGSWAGVLVIGIIELFGIAVLARRWGIEEIPQILSKFLDRTADYIKPPVANSPSNGDSMPKS